MTFEYGELMSELFKHVRRAAWGMAALVCCGDVAAETSLWKVSHEDRHLFIAGTVHILGEADYPLPDAFNEAYESQF